MASATESNAHSSPTDWLGRLIATVQNGLEVARFGRLGEPRPSPYAVLAEGSHHRLRRYYPESVKEGRPAVLLVPPLMLSAEVWDVSPESSGVAALHRSGADPWVVDFGCPEAEEGGMQRTLEDHVVGVSQAIETVRAATGKDIHLMGYSQGGMFCYQALAYRNALSDGDSGVASMVTFGASVDMLGSLPVDLPADMVADLATWLGELQASLFPSGIPSSLTRIGFQLMDPVKMVRQRIDFVRQLADREALQRKEGMRRFINEEGWTAFPGPALRDLLQQLVAQNRMMQGGLVIGEYTATLSSITCPILAFTGETDSIAPPPGVRAIRTAAPEADCYEVSLPGGHFALVVGSSSTEITWPAVAEWLAWQEGHGPRPKLAHEIPAPSEDVDKSRSLVEQVGSSLGLAWDLGRELIEDAQSAIGLPFTVLSRLTDAIVPQLPRLGRLDELRHDTPVSLGKLLEDRAQETPDGTFFLFEGRAHSYRDANVRIDNVVRGLLHCGVRQGDRVGVLMSTRPSAVASTVAISRLGAVAVLLRPDVPLDEQLELIHVDQLLADPEDAEAAHEIYDREVLVLGGGGKARTLAAGLIDMEAIDPDAVEPPPWYEPNPGLAGELGLVLITGDTGRLAINRVTNRRYATSAYGTATACALTPRDTVYCCSPTHHATGIMVCVGGTLVGGSRLAMAEPDENRFDSERFWDDVRRYGVSVVFYTGMMLRSLVNRPLTPAERSHPIRLFAGSGIPRGLWKRLGERFDPARVVEFYASTEGNAVLVNLTGRKVGSIGRALPGGAELAVAAYDLASGELLQDASGFTGHCPTGAIGLLLGGVDRARGEIDGRPLRGVFEPGDAWQSTGDLVRVDADGDYWLEGNVANVIRTAHGAVPAKGIESLLSMELDFVDLAAVYGVGLEDLGSEVLVAAITLRRDAKLDPAALRRRIESRLDAKHCPLVVRVLDALPRTAGHRIRKSTLREQGLGLDAGAGETLWLAPGEDRYVPLEADDVQRLVESVRGS
jgi:putative long chain acyl-CoA synthase